jgi:hypothetical protein
MLSLLDTMFGRDQDQRKPSGRPVQRGRHKARLGVEGLEERMVLTTPNIVGVFAIAGESLQLGTAFLGKSLAPPQVAPDGAGVYQDFQKASIYWSSATGAHDVYGAVYARWQLLGGSQKFGYPTIDEVNTPSRDGAIQYSHFQLTHWYKGLPIKSVGAIDATWGNGTHSVSGPIAALFASKGWEPANGEVISDQVDLTATGGSYQYFARPVYTGSGPTRHDFWSPYAINNTFATGAYVSYASSYLDINQGSNGTCWIDASIAAMEGRGRDLSQSIHYVGQNKYFVQLYVPNNPAQRQSGGYHVTPILVTFNGSTVPADAGYNVNQPSQSWVTVMQRAVILAVAKWDPSQSITNPHGGSAGDALATLKGFAGGSVGAQVSNAKQQVAAALAAGKSVVFGTQASPPNSLLVPDHDYAVLAVTTNGVELYNPWGPKATAPTPDPQVVPWSTIVQDGATFMFDS